jgi:hypothetical protein
MLEAWAKAKAGELGDARTTLATVASSTIEDVFQRRQRFLAKVRERRALGRR